jgi:hypothetical protein
MSTILKPKCFPLPSSLKVIAGTELAQAAYPYYMQFTKEDPAPITYSNFDSFVQVPADTLNCVFHERP